MYSHFTVNICIDYCMEDLFDTMLEIYYNVASKLVLRVRKRIFFHFYFLFCLFSKIIFI